MWKARDKRIRAHGLEDGTKISVHHEEGGYTEKLPYSGCGLPSAASTQMRGADVAQWRLLESGWTGWNTPDEAASTTWRVMCQKLGLILVGIH